MSEHIRYEETFVHDGKTLASVRRAPSDGESSIVTAVSRWFRGWPVPAAAVFLAVVAATARVAPAEESAARFLQALRENGYGDMAVEYLDILKKRPNVPQGTLDVWDLEMSRSLQAAAAEAYNAAEREQLTKESQRYLAKFVKEHPNHPEAVAAAALLNSLPAKHALQLIKKAKSLEDRDQEKRTELLREARAALEKSREKFRKMAENANAKLDEARRRHKGLPTAKEKKPVPDELATTLRETQSNLYEALYQVALMDYYLAQTYPEPTSQERIGALNKANKEFAEIRYGDQAIGMYALMWQGKIAEERGDLQTALDIYDEFVCSAPEPEKKNADPNQDSLYTQVQNARLLVLAKQKPDEYVTQATAWLKDYQRLKSTDGYQGIALELASAKFAVAQKAIPSERTKLLGELLPWVNDMIRFPGPYQQKLILLRLEIMKATGQEKSGPSSFDEAVTLADAAKAAQDWNTALSDYSAALELAKTTQLKDETRLAAVRESLAETRLAMAYDLYRKGKTRECLEMAKNVAMKGEASSVAAQAASLAMGAALNLYASASDAEKSASLAQLLEIAEFTEKHWPDRSEADDARMARGQAKLVGGQIAEAIEIFERVSPKSERYAVAMFLAGENYWRRYLTEKKKPEDARDAKQMAADRANAVERLTSGLAKCKSQVEPYKPLPKYMIEAECLLAEILVASDKTAQAIPLYQAVIEAAKSEKTRDFDNALVQAFVGAARAYVSLGEIDAANQVAATLVELGPDTLLVNGALVEIASMLNAERKKEDARITEMGSAARLGEVEEARKNATLLREMLRKLLAQLATRQQFSPIGMVFLGDAMTAVGMTDEAGKQYQKILKQMSADPEFAKTAIKAVPRVRAHLIAVLRQEGRFDEAMKQVNMLIDENPKVLEFRMEKGRVLEAWAEKAPSRYLEAASHWSDLRLRLQQVPGKKSDEYYEVNYHAANCLIQSALSSLDPQVRKERAIQAEKILNFILVQYPNLNGPQLVTDYHALLEKAKRLQGR